jgi:hypothetical protein
MERKYAVELQPLREALDSGRGGQLKKWCRSGNTKNCSFAAPDRRSRRADSQSAKVRAISIASAARHPVNNDMDPLAIAAVSIGFKKPKSNL